MSLEQPTEKKKIARNPFVDDEAELSGSDDSSSEDFEDESDEDELESPTPSPNQQTPLSEGKMMGIYRLLVKCI